MIEINWFWLTAICLIISFSVTVCIVNYFRYKAGRFDIGTVRKGPRDGNNSGIDRRGVIKGDEDLV